METTTQTVVVDEGGEPLAMVDMTKIDTEAVQLAQEMAAVCDDPAALERVQATCLARVGSREFGWVCAGAGRALAEYLLSPTLDAAAEVGLDLRPGLRRLASERETAGGGDPS